MRAKKETKGSWTSPSRLSTKGTGKGKWSCGKGQSWNEKGGQGGNDGGKNPWQKGSGKKGGTCGKTGHIAAWCRKGGNKNLFAIDEDDIENAEESAENEEDLQAWCPLKESENEQWQEVISR